MERKQAIEYLKEIIKKKKSRKYSKEIIIRTQLKNQFPEYKAISLTTAAKNERTFNSTK